MKKKVICCLLVCLLFFFSFIVSVLFVNCDICKWNGCTVYALQHQQTQLMMNIMKILPARNETHNHMCTDHSIERRGWWIHTHMKMILCEHDNICYIRCYGFCFYNVVSWFCLCVVLCSAWNPTMCVSCKSKLSWLPIDAQQSRVSKLLKNINYYI